MSTPHPTAEQIDRYRNRSASAEELIRVDSHIAECDRCHAALGVDAAEEIIVTLPGAPSSEENEHLSYDEMEHWVDGRLSDVEREMVEGHIAECGRCREELADLNRVRKELQPFIDSARASRRMRWLLPVAAMLTVVAGGTWLVLRNESSPVAPRVTRKPPAAVRPESGTSADPLRAHLDEVRRTGRLIRPEVLAVLAPGAVALRGSGSGGAAFSLLEPMGTVIRDVRPEFRWMPVRGASSYSVAILDVEKGDIVDSGTTTKPSWRPAEPLERGRTYSWQVTAQLDRRVVTAPRPPAPEALFRVASQNQIGELSIWQERMRDDHLGLGILLAERGFLDDAERELQLAARGGERRANELLAQVQAWRKGLD